MQTAMQELIDEIVEHLTYDDDLTDDSRITLEKIRIKCIGKLELERQNIEDAANLPKEDRWYDAKKYSNCGEQYYNETYK